MERRRLGRTGHASSVAILGGAAFWEATPDEARRGFDLALAAGVNHLDIAPRYGLAEEVVGPLVPAVRERLFVGAKTMRKNPDGVRDQLDTTKRLLGCDTLDLYQAHAVTSLAELDERASAIDAIVAARDQGDTRFIGITGHDLGAPAAFREALRRWDLDTVMFAIYPRLWADTGYRDDAEALLAECVERDVGVMAIKAVARRPWSAPPGERPASPWYEPHTEPPAIDRGIAFALSTPGVHAFCTPGDLGLLPAVLDAAARVAPMDDAGRQRAIDEAAGDELIFPIPTR
jgi:aryl-alcohol dehydrogenase-like predicted oxidoreductase